VKKWFFYIFLLTQMKDLKAQDTSNLHKIQVHQESAISYKSRKLAIAGIHAGAYAGTLLILSQAWYKDEPKTSFQVFDDSKEWLQVDKVGHVWTAYNIANYSTQMWEWSGFAPKKAAILGGISSIGYQTILEVLDAHSAKWGWSWADVAANITGAGMFTFQELAWGEQRIRFKFSSHPVKYAADLKTRADELYGKTFPERLLKDYNGQTYWLSMNLKSMWQSDKVPSWLNLAVGYGAKGLFGGFENRVIKNGFPVFDRSDIPRLRQWYLSPDIDFSKIKTNKKGVRTLFTLLNMIKMPAPALELTNGKLKGRLLYF
jgi:uncharacterized protein YfiM (DUF2279 family)